MDYTYEADVERVEGDWLVSFRQFPGSFGGGRTLRRACENAAEALRLIIADRVADGEDLPAPTFHNPPRAVFTVQVDAGYIAATECVTPSAAAEMLGVSRGRVSQLIRSGALETANVDGRSMVTIASVNARIDNPPASHRPRG